VQNAGLDTDKADKSSRLHDQRKKLRHFLEHSDLYTAQGILELIPNDYLHHERAILLARSGQYKEAFDICVGTIDDIIHANKVAKLACKWNTDEKKIYTSLHASLQHYGKTDAARDLLNTYNKQIDFVEVTKCIQDEEEMGE